MTPRINKPTSADETQQGEIPSPENQTLVI